MVCCLVGIVFEEMNHLFKLSDVHDIFGEGLFNEKAIRTVSLGDWLKLRNQASKAVEKHL